jgi:glycosyltransferase involved in cell wall biosynthesis
MKVCVLTSVNSPYDVRIFHKEARTLARAGYEVVILAPHEVAEEIVDGIRVVGLPKYRRRIGRLLNWPRFLLRGLRERADIYHFHNPDLLFVGVGLRLLTGKPVIYDCHENFADEIRYKEWIPGALRPGVAFLFSIAEPLLARAMSAVVGVEVTQAQRLPKVTLVQNFPDLSFFPPAEGTRVASRLIHVGLLSPARGAFLLLDVVALLREQGVDVEMYLPGSFDSQDTKAQMENRLKEEGLASAVHILGQLPYEQVNRYLASAAVALIPYQLTAPTLKAVPGKMFEYMAVGLPFVAGDMGAIRRFAGDLDCGILVPPESPAAYAQAITDLLRHPDRARRMGEAGRRAVWERYNWEPEGRRLLALYESLLR